MADILKFDFKRDYERILQFLSDCYKENPECWLPERFDDLVYRVCALWKEAYLWDYIFIAEIEGRIVACIFPDGDNFCVNIRPGFENIYPQLLTFAEKELRPLFRKNENGNIAFFAVVNENQKELQAYLIKNGYEKYPILQYDNVLNPQNWDMKIQLPQGFHVTYGETVNDEALKLWTCNVGFHPEREKDENYLNYMDIEPYNVRKNSVFYQESFECLIQSDDGEICAYSFCYINKSAKTAYLEPVCTRSAYRNKGLGKAMIGGVIARCKSLGITHCRVCSFGDDRKGFYQSIGFVTQSADSFWKKEI